MAAQQAEQQRSQLGVQDELAGVRGPSGQLGSNVVQLRSVDVSAFVRSHRSHGWLGCPEVSLRLAAAVARCRNKARLDDEGVG